MCLDARRTYKNLDELLKKGDSEEADGHGLYAYDPEGQKYLMTARDRSQRFGIWIKRGSCSPPTATDMIYPAAYGRLRQWESFRERSHYQVSLRNSYTYNAEYTDASTGNQYLRARYYSPETGYF